MAKKGLTIEEKAKAYDEALKVLHKYDGANIMFSQSLKEEMFPELKGNDDKRIKKELLSFLKDGTPYYCPNSAKRQEWAAWLEKQGEQNPIWSKEDEYILETLFIRLNNEQDDYPQQSCDFQEIQEIKEWLKSLKDRVQPKQELNEKEIENCAREAEDNNCIILAKHIRNLKKFLCPQFGDYHEGFKKGFAKAREMHYDNWKPSDEQMEALSYEVDAWDEDSANGQNLRSLYEQLKKLREE